MKKEHRLEDQANLPNQLSWKDYGRKRYKAEFVKFLVYSLGSNDESIDHLENLFKTKSLQDEVLYNYLHAKLETLGKKINLFIKGVDNTDWEKK